MLAAAALCKSNTIFEWRKKDYLKYIRAALQCEWDATKCEWECVLGAQRTGRTQNSLCASAVWPSNWNEVASSACNSLRYAWKKIKCSKNKLWAEIPRTLCHNYCSVAFNSSEVEWTKLQKMRNNKHSSQNKEDAHGHNDKKKAATWSNTESNRARTPIQFMFVVGFCIVSALKSNMSVARLSRQLLQNYYHFITLYTKQTRNNFHRMVFPLVSWSSWTDTRRNGFG